MTKTVTFYHSMICPRCRLVSRSLAALLPSYPGIRLERVEYLANLKRAGRDGVRMIPALVSGSESLAGFYLTRAGIRDFLEAVDAD